MNITRPVVPVVPVIPPAPPGCYDAVVSNSGTQPGVPIRILIVEDHFVARLGIKEFINAQADLLVVGESQSGADAAHAYREFQPDVVLMDFRMPGLDGARATVAVRHVDPNAKILIVSSYDSQAEVRRALDAGALGYITKEAEPKALLDAIRVVAAGQRFLPSALVKHADAPVGERINPREIRILEMISQGKSNREIATAMGLTPGTMRVYVHQILGKLRVANRAAAVTTAMQLGLIDSKRTSEGHE